MLESVVGVRTGDERHGACPTTNELCERVADLFGMEDAVFLPFREYVQPNSNRRSHQTRR